MSLKSQQGYDNKWKEKYLYLLDEYKIKVQKTREHEELLCKTIIRLTLAAKGYDKQLEPYFDRIQQSVKSGLLDTQLKTDIDEFDKAVRHFTPNKACANGSDRSLLFDYLIRQFPNKKTVQAIKSIERKYQNDEFSSTDQLFAALMDAISVMQTSAPTQPDETSDSTPALDSEIICHQLLLLLDNLIIPFEFEERVEQLKIRLQHNHAAPSFSPLLDDFVTLLVNIKKHILSERRDIEDYLSNLTAQLTELGLQASGASTAEHQSNIYRKKLNQYVSAQMKDLQHKSDTAKTLEHLKHLINTRLVSIATQIQMLHVNEENQRLQTQRQLNKLSAKIAQIEAESSDLKSKLALEHDKAMRDPLTGLANRIAYDERLMTEFTRWQRYQTPLSLVICDIDNFKNINDTFGHKAGDKTLKIIAQLLTQNCRQSDFLSRFGGEEFTIVLPNTNKAEAMNFANKLRIIIEKSRFNYGNKSQTITISCGVSEFSEGDTTEAVFERADQALYDAKNSGRNLCLPG